MPLLQRPRWEVVVCLQITLNELSLITCRKCACRPIGMFTYICVSLPRHVLRT